MSETNDDQKTASALRKVHAAQENATEAVAQLRMVAELTKSAITAQSSRIESLEAHLTALRAVLGLPADADAAQVVERVKAVVEALTEAKLQIEYLDGKFQPTGTSAAVLAKIRAALHGAPGAQGE